MGDHPLELDAGWDEADSPPEVEPHENLAQTFSFIPDEPRYAVRVDHSAYGQVVQLEGCRATDGTPRTQGSGVFIAPDLLITAAHVVFDNARDIFDTIRAGGYAGKLNVKSPVLRIPVAARETTRFIAAGGYRSNKDPSYDLAVVKLAVPVNDAAGLSPFAATPEQLELIQLAVFGYPEGANDRLYSAAGRCIGNINGLIFHTADVSSGMSGGAVVAKVQGGTKLVALHRAGPMESPIDYPDSCGAVRLTPGAIQWIEGRKLKL